MFEQHIIFKVISSVISHILKFLKHLVIFHPWKLANPIFCSSKYKQQIKHILITLFDLIDSFKNMSLQVMTTVHFLEISHVVESFHDKKQLFYLLWYSHQCIVFRWLQEVQLQKCSHFLISMTNLIVASEWPI